jgi:AcrR family transcriptional regulator
VTSRARTRARQERSQTTVNTLLDAARQLFAGDGYAATSVDAVCLRAGVTKGAFYHHFNNKKDLFRAVYEKEQKSLSALISDVYVQQSDPWWGFYEGCRVFLEACLEPVVQKITLIEAPVVLNWTEMRDIKVDCMSLMRVGVARAIAHGRISDQPVEPLIALLYGALCESAVAIAQSGDQRAMLDQTLVILQKIFRACETTGAASHRPGEAAGVPLPPSD